jgi:ABC-type Fe3+-siderophore transport system permease subunit
VSPSLLFLGLIYGSIGMGFFVYGKRQSLPVPLLCGLLLMVVPYFISNTTVLFAIGAALCVIPYFLRI